MSSSSNRPTSPLKIDKKSSKPAVDQKTPSNPPMEDNGNVTPWSDVCKYLEQKRKARLPKCATPFAPAIIEQVEETPNVLDKHFFSPRGRVNKRKREASSYAFEWAARQGFDWDQPLMQFSRMLEREEEGAPKRLKLHRRDAEIGEDEQENEFEDKEDDEVGEQLEEECEDESDNEVENDEEKEEDNQDANEQEDEENQASEFETEEEEEEQEHHEYRGKRRVFAELPVEYSSEEEDDDSSDESSEITAWSHLSENERLHWMFQGKGLSRKYKRENFVPKTPGESNWLKRTTRYYRPEFQDDIYLRSPCEGRGSGAHRDDEGDTSDEELVFVPTPRRQGSPTKNVDPEPAGEVSEAEGVPNFILDIARGENAEEPSKEQDDETTDWKFVHQVTTVDASRKWRTFSLVDGWLELLSMDLTSQACPSVALRSIPTSPSCSPCYKSSSPMKTIISFIESWQIVDQTQQLPLCSSYKPNATMYGSRIKLSCPTSL
ncbi:hypothetical protein TWF506_004104 [Arthrobotrys conoides]|uniref:Uncharacterized protein n=1 Tax=Arthrobotrys conoides TaxID=74498 RepID=A0AAN8P4U3_9PEZI